MQYHAGLDLRLSIALTMAKTLWSFGHSECKRVNDLLLEAI